MPFFLSLPPLFLSAHSPKITFHYNRFIAKWRTSRVRRGPLSRSTPHTRFMVFRRSFPAQRRLIHSLPNALLRFTPPNATLLHLHLHLHSKPPTTNRRSHLGRLLLRRPGRRPARPPKRPPSHLHLLPPQLLPRQIPRRRHRPPPLRSRNNIQNPSPYR